MKEQTPTDFLTELYNNAMSVVGSKETITSDLRQNEKELLDLILNYSEQARAVLTVIITSLTYKALHPEQDIRNYQASIAGGYSGRTFDGKNITPFMKKYKFPSMAESGWLTRALEQKIPYNKNYSGAITPKELKPVFLDILDNIEVGADCNRYLSYLFQGLIIKRNKYYILSTAYPEKEEYIKIEAEIQRIKNVHGCQLIVNGIMPTLKYYLRLLTNTFEFIDNYVNLLEADKALKFEHKENWNKLISEMK